MSAENASRVRLSISDWPKVVEAWWTLLRVDWVIRRSNYAAWRHWLDPLPPEFERDVDPDFSRYLVDLTERVALRHVRPMNRLRCALAAKRMLERRGLSCHLHLGVRCDETGIETHAWLTDVVGTLLTESPEMLKRYQELTRDQWATTVVHSEYD